MRKDCNMKKILLFIIILSIGLFPACSNNTGEDNMITYESGNYYDKNWCETIGTYSGAVIPNENAALEIARVIFNNMDKNKEVQKYIPKSIFYDNQDKIWIVSFGKKTNEITVGENCNIAIQETDGKVLRIWFDE